MQKCVYQLILFVLSNPYFFFHFCGRLTNAFGRIQEKEIVFTKRTSLIAYKVELTNCYIVN